MKSNEVDLERRNFVKSTAAGAGFIALAACGGVEPSGSSSVAERGASVTPSAGLTGSEALPTGQQVSTPTSPTPVPSPVPVPTATLPANLPPWAAILPPWQWYQIPNTSLQAFDSANLPGRPPGVTGPSSKIVAWCGATLKRHGSLYLLGAAGGHADYAGNEVNALDLSAVNPQWAMLRAPSSTADIIDSAPVYLDNRRAATHTYYATQFWEAGNRMILMAAPGMGFPSLPQPPSGFRWTDYNALNMMFSLDRAEWDAPDVNPGFPGSPNSDWTACMACTDASTGEIYYARSGDNGRFWKFNPATKVWTQLPNINHGNYAGSAVDHTRQRILIVGGYSATAPKVVTTSGLSVDARFGGLGASALTVAGYPAVVYDDALDAFLVFVNTNPLSVYAVNASTWEVSSPSTTAYAPSPTNGSKPGSRQNGLLNAVQYAPELRGVVVANSYSGNVYFMRTS